MMNSIMKSMELNRREDKLTSVHIRWPLQQNLFQSLCTGLYKPQGHSLFKVSQLFVNYTFKKIRSEKDT